MYELRKSSVLAGIAIVALMAAATTQAEKYKAPASEVVLLPRFCWAQYMEKVEGPQYSISAAECGYSMNHYCPGLIELNRAHKPSLKRGERLSHLGVAKENTLYTLSGMKEYPRCPIRSHVEKTLRQIDQELKVYGR